MNEEEKISAIMKKIEENIKGMINDGYITESKGITNNYLILKGSKKDLKYKKGKWELPMCDPFDSLRIAKVYIKQNIGSVKLNFECRLPGKINEVIIEGVITK